MSEEVGYSEGHYRTVVNVKTGKVIELSYDGPFERTPFGFVGDFDERVNWFNSVAKPKIKAFTAQGPAKEEA